MSFVVQITLLTGLIQSTMTCKLPGTNLQSLWMEFPPLISRNNSGEETTVSGALFTGLTSMLKACCHATVTTSWDKIAWNTRHLESIFNGQDDIALPITRTILFHTFTSKVPSWEYIPLVETPGPMLLKDEDRTHNIVVMGVIGTWPFLILLLSSAAIAGVIMWALIFVLFISGYDRQDRISNPEMFPRGFLKGFWEGIWWAYVSMTTVGTVPVARWPLTWLCVEGFSLTFAVPSANLPTFTQYGDKTPRSVAGRLFGFVWIIVGIVMISIFTATLATAFTQDPGIDIRGLNIGVLNGSSEYLVAYTHGANAIEYETITDLINALKKQEALSGILVDSFLGLQHFAQMSRNKIDIQGFIPCPATHGILFQDFSTDVVECLSREAMKIKFLVYEEMMDNIGTVIQKNEADNIWKKSVQISHSNMELTYACIGTWLGIFIVMLLWEFIYWRPRNAIPEVPKTLDKKDNQLKESKT